MWSTPEEVHYVSTTTLLTLTSITSALRQLVQRLSPSMQDTDSWPYEDNDVLCLCTNTRTRTCCQLLCLIQESTELDQRLQKKKLVVESQSPESFVIILLLWLLLYHSQGCAWANTQGMKLVFLVMKIRCELDCEDLKSTRKSVLVTVILWGRINTEKRNLVIRNIWKGDQLYELLINTRAMRLVWFNCDKNLYSR